LSYWGELLTGTGRSGWHGIGPVFPLLRGAGPSARIPPFVFSPGPKFLQQGFGLFPQSTATIGQGFALTRERLRSAHGLSDLLFKRLVHARILHQARKSCADGAGIFTETISTQHLLTHRMAVLSAKQNAPDSI
jgi:hypothetical protein